MYSQRTKSAYERNREPILERLRVFLSDRFGVLEIGSGTGQHAAFFAAQLPHLIWQSSDRAENLADIRLRLAEAGLANAPAPIELDAEFGPWPNRRYDAIFSANTLHIMSWAQVESFFSGLATIANNAGKLAVYGPFNYDGTFTSASNAAFDASLKARAAHMGIRDFEAVDALAKRAGFTLCEDIAMPANNRLLLWQREA